jgi:intein/homing endonuclease
MKTDSPEAQRYRPPLHHRCLVAGTKVLTINGEKNIEDIQIFDLVLTHLNNYYPVYNLMSREADDILEITTNNRTIKITSDHPVLAKRNNEVYWILAGELTEQDEIVVV